MGLLNDARVEALLDRLHAQSSAQDAALQQYFAKRAEEGTLDWKGLDADAHRFMSDKLVALDRDKSELCYQLCRALRAKRVIEEDSRAAQAFVDRWRPKVEAISVSVWRSRVRSLVTAFGRSGMSIQDCPLLRDMKTPTSVPT